MDSESVTSGRSEPLSESNSTLLSQLRLRDSDSEPESGDKLEVTTNLRC